MRLCRFEHGGHTQVGFYSEDSIIPLMAAADFAGIELPESSCLLPFLPGGDSRYVVLAIQKSLASRMDE